MADEFEIDKRVEAARRAESKTPARRAVPYSEQEKKKKLAGYVEVPPDRWQSLPIRSHIRYEINTGEFRPGGFIQNRWTKDGNIPMLHLENGFDSRKPGYRKWPVAFGDVKTIWTRPGDLEGAGSGSTSSTASTPTASPDLTARVAEIEARIGRLEAAVSTMKNVLLKQLRSAGTTSLRTADDI